MKEGVIINKIGIYAISFICVIVISWGAYKKINVFECFKSGIKDGLLLLYNIFPTLFALFTAIALLRESGLCDRAVDIIKPVTDFFHFPSELVPFALLRPISGSGSLALASDLFKTYGTDSSLGRAASVMMGSTETTFYTISVYFAASKTKNIRHTLKCALMADAFSMILSLVICHFYF